MQDLGYSAFSEAFREVFGWRALVLTLPAFEITESIITFSSVTER